jgi:hypothetical protein
VSNLVVREARGTTGGLNSEGISANSWRSTSSKFSLMSSVRTLSKSPVHEGVRFLFAAEAEMLAIALTARRLWLGTGRR